jgi:hypothetical protein
MRKPFNARLSAGLIIPSITISIVPLNPAAAVPNTFEKMIDLVLSLKEHEVLVLEALIEHEGVAVGLVT